MTSRIGVSARPPLLLRPLSPSQHRLATHPHGTVSPSQTALMHQQGISCDARILHTCQPPLPPPDIPNCSCGRVFPVSVSLLLHIPLCPPSALSPPQHTLHLPGISWHRSGAVGGILHGRVERGQRGRDSWGQRGACSGHTHTHKARFKGGSAAAAAVVVVVGEMVLQDCPVGGLGGEGSESAGRCSQGGSGTDGVLGVGWGLGVPPWH